MDIPSVILNLGNRTTSSNPRELVDQTEAFPQEENIEELSNMFKSCVINPNRSYEDKFLFPNISRKLEKTPLPVIDMRSLINVPATIDDNEQEKKFVVSQIDIIRNSYNKNAGKNKPNILKAEKIDEYCRIFKIKCTGNKESKIEQLLKVILQYQSNYQTQTTTEIVQQDIGYDPSRFLSLSQNLNEYY